MFDLTSEVTGLPRTIKLDTIGFLSLRATRSFFFSRSSRTIRGRTARGGPTDPPPYKLDAVKSRTRARVNGSNLVVIVKENDGNRSYSTNLT